MAAKVRSTISRSRQFLQYRVGRSVFNIAAVGATNFIGGISKRSTIRLSSALATGFPSIVTGGPSPSAWASRATAVIPTTDPPVESTRLSEDGTVRLLEDGISFRDLEGIGTAGIVLPIPAVSAFEIAGGTSEFIVQLSVASATISYASVITSVSGIVEDRVYRIPVSFASQIICYQSTEFVIPPTITEMGAVSSNGITGGILGFLGAETEATVSTSIPGGEIEKLIIIETNIADATSYISDISFTKIFESIAISASGSSGNVLDILITNMSGAEATSDVSTINSTRVLGTNAITAVGFAAGNIKTIETDKSAVQITGSVGSFGRTMVVNIAAATTTGIIGFIAVGASTTLYIEPVLMEGIIGDQSLESALDIDTVDATGFSAISTMGPSPEASAILASGIVGDSSYALARNN